MVYRWKVGGAVQIRVRHVALSSGPHESLREHVRPAAAGGGRFRRDRPELGRVLVTCHVLLILAVVVEEAGACHVFRKGKLVAEKGEAGGIGWRLAYVRDYPRAVGGCFEVGFGFSEGRTDKKCPWGGVVDRRTVGQSVGGFLVCSVVSPAFLLCFYLSEGPCCIFKTSTTVYRNVWATLLLPVAAIESRCGSAQPVETWHGNGRYLSRHVEDGVVTRILLVKPFLNYVKFSPT